MLVSFRPSRDETPLLRFALAEGLVRMSAASAPRQSACPFTMSSHSAAAQGVLSQPLDGESFGSEHLPVLTRVLLGIIETAVANGSSFSPSFETSSLLPEVARPPGTLDKSTAGVLLLVLVKQSGSSLHSSTLNGTSPSNSLLPKLKALPKKEVIRTTELFLQLLREKDAFLQDMSCAGLCYLFNRACQFDKNLAVSPLLLVNGCDAADSRGLLLSEIVGREVIATLTREKRGPQAAGESLLLLEVPRFCNLHTASLLLSFGRCCCGRRGYKHKFCWGHGPSARCCLESSASGGGRNGEKSSRSALYKSRLVKFESPRFPNFQCPDK
jgi:hypothetical protein